MTTLTRPTLTLTDVLAASPGGWTCSVDENGPRQTWTARSPLGGTLECGSARELICLMHECERSNEANEEAW